jgi:flagellar secretion chaperone FliS
MTNLLLEEIIMYQSDATKQYKENSVYTMRAEELTLALYNGLVKFLMKAELGLTEKDLEMANNNLFKAEDILYEFVLTLNMEYEVSNGLAILYDYMIRRIREANVGKDIEIVREVLGFAKELRDTWQDAMKIARHVNVKPELAHAK